MALNTQGTPPERPPAIPARYFEYSTFCGKRLCEMNKKELIGVVKHLNKELEESRKSTKKALSSSFFNG